MPIVEARTAAHVVEELLVSVEAALKLSRNASTNSDGRMADARQTLEEIHSKLLRDGLRGAPGDTLF